MSRSKPRSKPRFLSALATCCGLVLFAPGAQAHTDDFNRQTLGPGWEVLIGDR